MMQEVGISEQFPSYYITRSMGLPTLASPSPSPSLLFLIFVLGGMVGDFWNSLFFLFSFFLGLHLPHMEVPRLGVNWSCGFQPTPQPQREGIFNPLNESRDQTHILMDTGRVLKWLGHNENS